MPHLATKGTFDNYHYANGISHHTHRRTYRDREDHSSSFRKFLLVKTQRRCHSVSGKVCWMPMHQIWNEEARGVVVPPTGPALPIGGPLPGFHHQTATVPQQHRYPCSGGPIFERRAFRNATTCSHYTHSGFTVQGYCCENSWHPPEFGLQQGPSIC